MRPAISAVLGSLQTRGRRPVQTTVVLLASIWMGLIRAGANEFEFFESKIRPVLVARCYECHSVESKKVKGGLRLDTREAFQKGGDSGPLVNRGEVEKSRLLAAIRYQDPDLQMPPKGKLAEAELADFITWIKAGAPYPAGAVAKAETLAGTKPRLDPATARNHWSFRPRQDPPVPVVKNAGWAKTRVDSFILAKQEEKGLQPGPLADRRALIRRATFDLTGLPPTPADVVAFLRDPSPEAFARVVDRLLASSQYGERWGRHWLDVVRYADTAGETADFPVPVAFRYRDYVIRAFNQDKPYDQFIREQIAGDLIAASAPAAEYADRVTAPGYLAISRRFGFGETYSYQHLVIEDTIGTLGKSILGLTIGCARCHDHKFDPISAADYYGLYGIFASSRYSFPGNEEKKRPRDLVPLLPPAQVESLTKSHAARLAAVDSEIKELEAERVTLDQQIQTGMATMPNFPTHARLASVAVPENSQNGTGNRPLTERLWMARFPAGASRGIGWLVSSNLPSVVAGSSANASEFTLHVTGSYRAPNIPDPAKASLTFEFDRPAAVRELEIIEHSNGIAELEVRVSDAVTELEQAATSLGRHTGSLGPGPFKEFATNHFQISGGLVPRKFLRVIVTRTPHASAFAAYRIFPRAWNGERVREVESMTGTAAPGPPLAAKDQAQLAAWETTRRQLSQAMATARQKREVVAASAPVIDVAYSMAEGSPQNARIQRRGDPFNLSDEVPRKFLDVLGGQKLPPESKGSGRLELADWLADAANPLTARVMVNRIWQYHFGRGLVRTPNNFGKQGRAPTHPELLDFLASRFIESGWSVKAMHRLIMLSATYQLASGNDPANERLDPENELCWKFNRQRLDAESIRDAVLFISGGLDTTPSPRHPFPPENTWGFTQHSPFGAEYASQRRSVYLMTQRIRRHSFLALFDGPDANESTAERAVTTTPLQALYMMNSPFIHEQSALLAGRLARPARNEAERVRLAYELVLGREATPAEIAADTDYVRACAERLAQAGTPADARENAAWAAHARVLLTRNEFLFVD